MKAAPVPDVYLIGLGIPEVYAMSLEAHQAAGRCRVLFVNQPNAPALRKLGPELRPIGDLRAGADEESLQALSERVLAERRPGQPVGLAIYGHPLVYEPCCLRILDEARRRKLRVEVVAGVSAVDTILAAMRLPLARGVGLRAADPAYALSPSFSPEPGAHTLIFKACQDLAQLRGLVDKLRPAYPRAHRAALVECLDGDVESVLWSPLPKLAARVTRPRLFATLLVPAVGVRPR